MTDGLEIVALEVLSWSAKSLPVLALGWLGARALRSAGAAARHRVWAATLAVLALAPVLSWVGGGWEIPWKVTHPSARSMVTELSAVWPMGPADSEAQAEDATSPVDTQGSAPTRVDEFVRWLGLAYLTGVLAGLGYLGLGAARIARLCRRAGDDLSEEATQRLLARAGVPRSRRDLVRLRFSAEAAVPFAWGLFRPVIVLPVDARRWSPERLHNALIHELAHVERRDGWYQWTSRLVGVVYWCQPLVSWAARRMRLEAERACDDRVLAAGGSAPRYAQQLVDLTRRARQGALMLEPLGLARRSDLPARVGALLTSSRRRARPVLTAIWIAAVALAGAGAATLHSAEPASRSVPDEPRELPPILKAARRGDLGELRRLIASGADLDQTPRGEASPLMEAARSGHVEAVRLLIGRGADPNRRVPGDGSPLISAVRGGSESVVRELLRAGADPRIGVPGDGNPLIAAVEGGEPGLVGLLLEAGADPYDHVAGDETALSRAAERGRRDLVELLVARRKS